MRAPRLGANEREIVGRVTSEASRLAGRPVRSTVLDVSRARRAPGIVVRLDDAGRSRDVVVRQPRRDAYSRYEAASSPEGRARLKGVADPADRLARERATLIDISRMVRTGEDRWAALEPDDVDIDGLLVLERPTDPDLSVAIADDEPAAPRLMADLGAWLCEFHAGPTPASAVRILDSPAAFEAAVDRLTSFLAGNGVESDRLESIRRRIRMLIGSDGDERSWTRVTAHGDFTLRNVLVRNGRIAVHGTARDWAAPAALDLATWRVVEELGRGGRAAAEWDRLAAALLSGYGPAAPDEQVVTAFECGVLLDKWASAVSGGRRSLRKRIRARAGTTRIDRIGDLLDRRLAAT